jgi:FlaA1/EpsC-like NDP-sugar epimerase
VSGERVSCVAGARVLITGGTGSFADVAIDRLLGDGAAAVTVYSRDEYKQSLVAGRFAGRAAVRCVLGDVRDECRLAEALAGIDVVIHAAAMKQVPACERHPGEAVLTNVVGSLNVVRAARQAGVTRVVNLSADKASLPGSVYGATKMLSERIFTEAGVAHDGALRAVSVRYSNVLGSRGSVVETWEQALWDGRPLTVLDPRMTRLVLTQDEVVDLVLYALDKAVGGEVFLKDCAAMRIVDLAKAMVAVHGRGEVDVREGEARAGEVYDAGTLSAEEAEHTVLTREGYYVILPTLPDRPREAYLAPHPGAKPLPAEGLGSATARVLTVDELVEMLRARPRGSR